MRFSSYFLRSLPLLALVLMASSGCDEAAAVNTKKDDQQPVVNADPVDDVIIYQVNPKLFEKGKSFQQIDARLPEIKKLGTNVLYLMPIYPEGKVKAVGSPYCISDYEAVNADYGTLADLKTLVADAHKAGMRVMLDWVANHTSWDHPWLEAHKDWYTQDAGGNVTSPAGMGWNDVADLNFASKGMRSAMLSAMTFWVTEAGVDGFRCDYADGVPADFWQEAIKALRDIKRQELLMLAESSDKAFYSCGFDMVYGWRSTAKLQELYGGKASLSDFYTASAAELTEGHHARFITNHDQASEKCPLNHYNGKQGSLSAFVLSTMLGGYPFIYSSQEAGYGQNLSFFNQWAFNWDMDVAYTEAYQRYMAAFVSTADLRSGTLKTYSTRDVASFFYEAADGHGVLVMLNPTAKALTVKSPMEQAGMSFTDLIAGAPYVLPSTVTLEAYQYLILRR